MFRIYKSLEKEACDENDEVNDVSDKVKVPRRWRRSKRITGSGSGVVAIGKVEEKDVNAEEEQDGGGSKGGSFGGKAYLQLGLAKQLWLRREMRSGMTYSGDLGCRKPLILMEMMKKPLLLLLFQ